MNESLDFPTPTLQTSPIKAEITIRILSDGGGYVIQGHDIVNNPMSGQLEPQTDLMQARENSKDVVEDIRSYLASKSELSVVS